MLEPVDGVKQGLVAVVAKGVDALQHLLPYGEVVPSGFVDFCPVFPACAEAVEDVVSDVV